MPEGRVEAPVVGRVIFSSREEVNQCYREYVRRMTAAQDKRSEGRKLQEQVWRAAANKAADLVFEVHPEPTTLCQNYDRIIAKAVSDGTKKLNFQDVAEALRAT